MRHDGAAVLYTSLEREGALAEISFHWGQLDPRPTKPVMVHTLRAVADRTLKLVRADLEALGVPEAAYVGINPPRTQEIGEATEFLGCDGLIAPCARWPCDHLILFTDRMGVDASLELVTSEVVHWEAWATAHDLLKSPRVTCLGRAIIVPCCLRSVRSPQRAPVGVGASHQPDHFLCALRGATASTPEPATAAPCKGSGCSGPRTRMPAAPPANPTGQERPPCC